MVHWQGRVDFQGHRTPSIKASTYNLELKLCTKSWYGGAQALFADGDTSLTYVSEVFYSLSKKYKSTTASLRTKTCPMCASGRPLLHLPLLETSCTQHSSSVLHPQMESAVEARIHPLFLHGKHSLRAAPPPVPKERCSASALVGSDTLAIHLATEWNTDSIF